MFLSMLVRAAFQILLCLAAFRSIRLAWADHLSRDASLASRLRAVQMMPGEPNLYERVAAKREELGESPLTELQTAVDLDPANADRRLRLAVRAELAGDLQLAEPSHLQASTLSRQYQPKYSLAQYYFRRTDPDRFFAWAPAAFDSAYGDTTPLLDLCWRMRPDADWLPPGRTIARQWLAFLTARGEYKAALRTAGQLALDPTPEDRQALLQYCDSRLKSGGKDDALRIWNLITPGRTSAITNENFAASPTGIGFDWRLEKVDGASIRWRPASLHLTLSGKQPEDCVLVWQYLAAPRAVISRPSDVGAPGLEWRILQQPGPAKLALIYHRPAGSVRLEGTFEIRPVRLEGAP